MCWRSVRRWVLVPQNPTGATGKVLQNLILRGLNRAPQVACISEKTRQQLLEISSRPPATTTVIEMGLNYPYAPMPAEAAREFLRSLIGEPRADQALRRGFVLHVGANHWYKKPHRRPAHLQPFVERRRGKKRRS